VLKGSNRAIIIKKKFFMFFINSPLFNKTHRLLKRLNIVR
jgi:hypothetical protein